MNLEMYDQRKLLQHMFSVVTTGVGVGMNLFTDTLGGSFSELVGRGEASAVRSTVAYTSTSIIIQTLAFPSHSLYQCHTRSPYYAFPILQLWL